METPQLTISMEEFMRRTGLVEVTPSPMLYQVLKGSNSLSVMPGMLVVILSGDKSRSGKISKIQ